MFCLVKCTCMWAWLCVTLSYFFQIFFTFFFLLIAIDFKYLKIQARKICYFHGPHASARRYVTKYHLIAHFTPLVVVYYVQFFLIKKTVLLFPIFPIIILFLLNLVFFLVFVPALLSYFHTEL